MLKINTNILITRIKDWQFQKSEIQKTIQFFFVLSLSLYSSSIYAQFTPNVNVLTVADKFNGTNNDHALYYFPATNAWIPFENATGTQNINAIEYVASVNKCFAFENEMFGEINLANGTFVSINTLADANGNQGTFSLDNIYGMSYDQITGNLFAVHRTPGNTQNDILFVIDLNTLALKEDHFGQDIDYVSLEEVFNSSWNTDIYKVEEIAFNTSGDLFVCYSNGGINDNDETMAIIHPQTGSLDQVFFEPAYLLGMDFDNMDNLYFISVQLVQSEIFYYINYNNQSSSLINNLPPEFNDATSLTFLNSVLISPNFGCTDSLALNFNPNASADDGSCVYSNLTCFTVSENEAAPNTLFNYDAQAQAWISIGDIGSSFMEAIAFDQQSGILYGFDAGTFGTINLTNAQFNSIGNVGFANGELGSIELNDIDGLTYNPFTNVMLATHKRIGSQAHDLLFQVDVATGNFVPNAMLDNNGNPSDYALIEEVFQVSFYDDIYNVEDIALNPVSGDLYAVHYDDLGEYGVVSIINENDGSLEQALVQLTDFSNIEGLAFNSNNDLVASSGNNSTTSPNSFLLIDLFNNPTVNSLGAIDPTNTSVDFESIDCYQNLTFGCTDSIAVNYNPNATFDNGSCNYCDQMLSLTGLHTTGIYQADDVITSNGQVNSASNGPVSFYAGNNTGGSEYIELTGNFFADGTVYFEAINIECDPTD